MKLLAKLPETHRTIVTLVHETALRAGEEAFLVGGPVRDLLLDRATRDLDFCVTGSLDAITDELSRNPGGTVQSNPRFLTASIQTKSVRIDLARQRKERYPTPGALPEVTRGDLVEDLQRRDFSVNAIAVDLKEGEILDPCNGMEDLERRLIRVLHRRSFLDDPTRIWRAIRFSVRLGFEIEAVTLKLMSDAIENDSLATLSFDRLRAELVHSIQEPLAGATLCDLVKRGAMSPLFGSLDRDAALAAIGSADRASQIAPGADRLTLFVGALAAGSSNHDALSIRLSFPTKVMHDAFELFPRAHSIRDQITPTTGDRETLDLVSSDSPEVLALIALAQPDPVSFHRRWSSYRHYNPGVRGDELGLAPGPHIGHAIEQTKAALFLGEIDDSDAISFATNEALKYLGNQQ